MFQEGQRHTIRESTMVTNQRNAPNDTHMQTRMTTKVMEDEFSTQNMHSPCSPNAFSISLHRLDVNHGCHFILPGPVSMAALQHLVVISRRSSAVRFMSRNQFVETRRKRLDFPPEMVQKEKPIRLSDIHLPRDCFTQGHIVLITAQHALVSVPQENR